MKKLCFFNTLPFWGGGEKLHLEYALAFRELGYEVSMVAAPDSPAQQAAKEAGLE